MALLTPEQLAKVKEIIARHHSVVILRALGPDALTQAERAQLEAAGIDLATTPIEELIKQAYLYGYALAVEQTMAGKSERPATDWTFEEFEKHVTELPIELTPPEERAVTWATVNAAQHCRGLGNRIDVATGRVLIDADRELEAATAAAIGEEVSEGIEERKAVREVKSDLGWMAKDWSRDWDRIAVTELQDAHQHGQADAMKAAAGEGEDPLVFKQPRDAACEACRSLYLGSDGHPRIFRLSQLEAFGHNAGRKRSDWNPTIGPLHPRCMCVLVRIPNGWGFNADGDMVPGGKFGERYEPPEAPEGDPLEKGSKGRRVQVAGMTVRIENPVGSVRRWKDADGSEGKTKMRAPYGFIAGTVGMDGDEYDAYLGPDLDAPLVYVVHQLRPDTGEPDEEKVMLCFTSIEDAVDTYLAHRNDGTAALGGVTVLTVEDFRGRVFATETGSAVDLEPGVEMAKSAGAVPPVVILPRGPVADPKPKRRPALKKKQNRTRLVGLRAFLSSSDDRAEDIQARHDRVEEAARRASSRAASRVPVLFSALK